MKQKSNKTGVIINSLMVIGILVFLNIIGNYYYDNYDLTEDKRYTIAEPTKNLLEDLTETVTITVYLEGGEFPPGFKRLQTATKDLLAEFRSISKNVRYTFEDPLEGPVEEINKKRKILVERGLTPVNLQVVNSNEKSEKIIFPGAIIYYKNQSIPVLLLENEIPGMPKEQVLNNSVGLLEYKFANAIQKVQTKFKPIIAYTQGHGELAPLETADLDESLRQYYRVARINLDTLIQIPTNVKVLVVARPQVPFPDKHKFIIDQYVMNGGKVIWAVNTLRVDLDSLRKAPTYVPFPYKLELDDMLFKYGARINTNLILDLECTPIPQVVGMLGTGPQFEMKPYYYHPIVVPSAQHPISKNLDRVNLLFASTIDTVETKSNIKKTPILTSSAKSRMQFAPVTLNLEILRYAPDESKFNKKYQPLALMLEGEFDSNYKNRVSPKMKATLDKINQPFKGKSEKNKMLIIGDGDILRNGYKEVNGKYTYKPLGFNEYVKYRFANKDFMLNAFEYLIDENNIIAARSKEVKLRLLNRSKAQSGKGTWQLVNILLPVLILALFGVGYNYIRRKKYA